MNDQINYYKNKLEFEMDPADLFQLLEEGKEIIVIDTRKSFGYQNEHIPGAINIPLSEMSSDTTKNMDKLKEYVCYCDGIGCNASTKGALAMAKLGFKVKELIGGIEWWKFDSYATEGEKASAGKEMSCAC